MANRLMKIVAVLGLGAVGVLAPAGPAEAGGPPPTGEDLIFYRAGSAPDGLLTANGDGTFTQTPLAVGGYYQPLVGDFDGDGDSDVFWNGGYDRSFLWSSTGDGKFSSRRLDLGSEFDAHVGDFNGDGRDDLLELDYLPEAPSITHLSDGAGGFDDVEVDAGMSNQGTVLVGDLDDDGDDDVLIYGPGSEADGTFMSNGDGTFTPVGLNIVGYYEPHVGDFNDDGRTDVFFYAPGAPPDYLLLSNGNGTFTSIRFQVVGQYTLLPGDYDGDGDTDIMWYGFGTRPDYLWASNGDGSFASARRSVNGQYLPEVLRADTNATDDILWYRPGPSSDFVWLHDSAAQPTSIIQFIDFASPFDSDPFFDCCFEFRYTRQLVGDFVTSS